MSVFNPDPRSAIYALDATSKVTAQVVIGNGQRGGWAMKVTGLGTVKGSDEKVVKLGGGIALAGKLLQVNVTVVDVHPETNRLNAVVTVAGGPGAPLIISQEVPESADGDVAIFGALVMFQ
ncbi:MAG TPA: hypothetical protein VGP07_07010 [Polyangia bacterium]|jgi:hypothetical protein